MKKHSQPSAELQERMERLLYEKAATIRSRSAFKHQLYAKLSRTVHPQKHERAHVLDSILPAIGWFMRTQRPLFALFVVGILGASGVLTSYASASPQVTRESTLYPLNQAVEYLQFSLAIDPEDKADILLDFAKKRGDEAEYLFQKGIIDAETVESITKTMRNAVSIAGQVSDSQSRERLRDDINKTSAEERESLLAILSSVEHDQPPVQVFYGPTLAPALDNVEPPSSSPSVATPPPQALSLQSLKDTAQELTRIESITSTPMDTVQSENVVDQSSSYSSSRQRMAVSSERAIEPASAPASMSPARSIRQLPDIVLSAADSETFVEGKEGSVIVLLVNEGGGGAGSFTVKYDWGDGTTGQASIPEMNIGEERHLTLTHTFERKGQYFLQLVANSARSIVESSETNNASRVFVDVQASQSPKASPSSSSSVTISSAPSVQSTGNNTCVDSDGGLQLFTRGVASKNGVEVQDRCQGSAIVESYCDESGVLTTLELECAYGCSSGACTLAQ